MSKDILIIHQTNVKKMNISIMFKRSLLGELSLLVGKFA